MGWAAAGVPDSAETGIAEGVGMTGERGATAGVATVAGIGAAEGVGPGVGPGPGMDLRDPGGGSEVFGASPRSFEHSEHWATPTAFHWSH